MSISFGVPNRCPSVHTWAFEQPGGHLLVAERDGAIVGTGACVGFGLDRLDRRRSPCARRRAATRLGPGADRGRDRGARRARDRCCCWPARPAARSTSAWASSPRARYRVFYGPAHAKPAAPGGVRAATPADRAGDPRARRARHRRGPHAGRRRGARRRAWSRRRRRRAAPAVARRARSSPRDPAAGARAAGRGDRAGHPARRARGERAPPSRRCSRTAATERHGVVRMRRGAPVTWRPGARGASSACSSASDLGRRGRRGGGGLHHRRSASPRLRALPPDSSHSTSAAAVAVLGRLAPHGQQALAAEAHHRDGVGGDRHVVAAGEPVDRRQRARVVAAGDEHERGRLAAVDGLELGVRRSTSRSRSQEATSAAAPSARPSCHSTVSPVTRITTTRLRLLVEAEQVHVGDGLAREQADAGQAELAGERVPGGGDQRRAAPRGRAGSPDEAGRLRRHERPRSLIDAQHGGPVLLDRFANAERQTNRA